MCLLIYFLWSVILLSHEGKCDLTWDKVYGLLSAKLDKKILEQDIMKQEMKDLKSSMTATNQKVISLEKRLDEQASISQQMVVFQERLDNIDSHVKDFAMAEVGRRNHLLRRGLEQEKTTTQSRFGKSQVQIFKIGQESLNNISDLSARVEILDNKPDKIKYEVVVLASTIHKEFNETGMQISKLEHDMVVTLYNATSLFELFDSMKKKTQSDIKSEMKQDSEKTRTQIATMQQEVVTTQRNTQTLQSRVDTVERTQSNTKSKTSIIAAQVDTTRGQISRLQHVTGTFDGFSVRLNTKYLYYNKATVIKFDHVFYKEGGHFSPSTGIFSVPVSGVYVFMFNVQVDHDSSDENRRAHVVLCVNGNVKADTIEVGIDVDLTGGNAAVVKVSAGDRVYVSTPEFRERYYIWPYRTSFSGALLHVLL